MPGDKSQSRRIYVGLQEGVCTISGHGDTWIPGDVTPLAHASARLSVSPVVEGRAYLAAYEAGVYRTDDGGQTWKRLDAPIQAPTLTASRPTPVIVEPYTWAANLRLSTIHQMAENPGRNALDSQQCQNLISGDSI